MPKNLRTTAAADMKREMNSMVVETGKVIADKETDFKVVEVEGAIHMGVRAGVVTEARVIEILPISSVKEEEDSSISKDFNKKKDLQCLPLMIPQKNQRNSQADVDYLLAI